LKEGSSILCNKQRDKAILIMGASGAGKSTLCSLFGDFQLVARVDESIGNILIENS
jgi:ABC-type lipoprotein export system ATPase subunit